jgi:hypothetical protein
MSNAFAEREEGFEAKWAHDALLGFKIVARQTGLLGMWAAEQLHLSGMDAKEYVARLVALATLTKKDGIDPVLERLRQDFAAAGLTLTTATVQRLQAEFLETAKKELGVPA